MSKTSTGSKQIKRTINIDSIIKQLFQRAEFFTQRYIFCHPNRVNNLPLIRSIYRILLMPDNWLKMIKLPHKLQLYFIVHLKFGEKGVHPLQEVAYQKIQILLKYQQ